VTHLHSKKENELFRRLADYRQKKEIKKMEEMKNKKPPFKVGIYKLESACPSTKCESERPLSNTKVKFPGYV
jgi:hypothetical protein